MCKVKPRGTCVTSRMFQKNSIDRTLCWQEFGGNWQSLLFASENAIWGKSISKIANANTNLASLHSGINLIDLFTQAENDTCSGIFVPGLS